MRKKDYVLFKLDKHRTFRGKPYNRVNLGSSILNTFYNDKEDEWVLQKVLFLILDDSETEEKSFRTSISYECELPINEIRQQLSFFGIMEMEQES